MRADVPDDTQAVADSAHPASHCVWHHLVNPGHPIEETRELLLHHHGESRGRKRRADRTQRGQTDDKVAEPVNFLDQNAAGYSGKGGMSTTGPRAMSTRRLLFMRRSFY